MGVHEGGQQLGHLESTLASNGRAPRQRGRSMAPKWARPTMVVSRRPIGPHHLQLPLVGRHVSPILFFPMPKPLVMSLTAAGGLLDPCDTERCILIG